MKIDYKEKADNMLKIFIKDLQNDNKTPFLLQYFKALNEVGNLEFARLVKEKFPAQFKRVTGGGYKTI